MVVTDWRAALKLQFEFGVDEAIGNVPINRYRHAEINNSALRHIPNSQHSVSEREHDEIRQPLTINPQRISQDDTESAGITSSATQSLEELHAALKEFKGCKLKRTATNLVFGDGNPDAEVMIIGEAPGADEDRLGIPFVGVSGKLLDQMLSSVELDRNTIYVTNILPWRPPGNRKPTPAEVAACLPFTVRHIELVNPKILLLVGSAAAASLLDTNQSISRIRGRWQTYSSPGLIAPIDALPTFHPAYLLRTPGQKRLSWRDLITLKLKLREFAQ